MAAIPCATYQAGNVHSKLRRRHRSAPDVTLPHSRPFTPLAGLASTAESATSSASGSPAMPSSPTVSGNGTFFGNFFQISQRMKTLTDSWTTGINAKTEPTSCSTTTSQSPSPAPVPGSTETVPKQ